MVFRRIFIHVKGWPSDRLGCGVWLLMAFPNVRRILQIGSPSSSLKLILVVATTSRPRYKGIFLWLLRPFVRNGEITIRYRSYERFYETRLRMSDLAADFLSTRELCVYDIYRIDRGFKPDLVIDGGGNIGLFTLRAVAAAMQGTEIPRVVICEPLPRNVEQIWRHLKRNEVKAEVMPICLGGTRGRIPFYCRGANESSFDAGGAYDSVMEIPVVLLQDAIGNDPAERILIKLDIEGMEVETLSAFLPGEQRAVYLVGELHNYPVNAPLMRRLFDDNGWTLELYDIDRKTSSFRACSPAAVPLLAWAAGLREDHVEIR
jgi:FkbM family methyltransferase